MSQTCDWGPVLQEVIFFHVIHNALLVYSTAVHKGNEILAARTLQTAQRVLVPTCSAAVVGGRASSGRLAVGSMAAIWRMTGSCLAGLRRPSVCCSTSLASSQCPCKAFRVSGFRPLRSGCESREPALCILL